MKYFIIQKCYGPWEGSDMIAIFPTVEEAKNFVRNYEDEDCFLTITEYEMGKDGLSANTLFYYNHGIMEVAS